ncbi:MAG: hypothetical protein U0892_18935 [Pirellulales bacterium]
MQRLVKFVFGGLMACSLSSMLSDSARAQADNEPIAAAEPVAVAADKAPVAAASSVAAEKSNNEKNVRPLTVSVLLLRDTVITGVLTDSTQLMLKTAFGEASIPLTEVAGVRFPSAQDTSTTVVMLNGDSITGASDVKAVTVETEWGTAKINGQNIASMQFVPGLEWQNVNGLNGQRWTLVEPKLKPAG